MMGKVGTPEIEKGFGLLYGIARALEEDDYSTCRDLAGKLVKLQNDLFGKDYVKDPDNPFPEFQSALLSYNPSSRRNGYVSHWKGRMSDKMRELGLFPD